MCRITTSGEVIGADEAKGLEFQIISSLEGHGHVCNTSSCSQTIYQTIFCSSVSFSTFWFHISLRVFNPDINGGPLQHQTSLIKGLGIELDRQNAHIFADICTTMSVKRSDDLEVYGSAGSPQRSFPSLVMQLGKFSLCVSQRRSEKCLKYHEGSVMYWRRTPPGFDVLGSR